jgi:hypothetical protein
LKAIEGFFKHNEHELRPTIITRSSALFWVVEGKDLHTDLLLFNYWYHKRSVNDLEIQTTLRSISGETLGQSRSSIDFRGAKTLRVSDVLKVHEMRAPFEGSIELEIFSESNLFIPYPAICVRYYGESWHSMTHTYSRIFSLNSGDASARLNNVQRTVEGNWTIPGNQDLDTFFVVHNGPIAVEPHDLSIVLINSRGQTLAAKLAVDGYKPFETRRYVLSNIVDYVSFLEREPGAIEVSTFVAGVFPRMLAGFKRKNSSEFSIDHSNFNYMGEAGKEDCYPIDQKLNPALKSLGFAVPALIGTGWSTYVDIYPSYPQTDYQLKCQALNDRGVALDSPHLSVLGKSGSPRQIVRLPLDELLKEAKSGASVDLEIDHATSIPTRLHMGIHYQYGDGLPAFIIDGPMPFSYRGKFTRWFPVLEGSDERSFILLANQLFDSSQTDPITYSALLYNAFNNAPLACEFKLDPGASMIRPLAELFVNVGEFLGNQAGWIYMKSDKPSYAVLHYVIKKGEDSLAADHAF